MENQKEKTKILLVEDDENMGYLVKDYLEMTGFDVTLITDGAAVMPVFMGGNFHICLLDVMLPHKDGFAIATEMRQFNATIPIIFLTAKNVKEDRLHGFRIGGDDYVTKPFSIEELHLRIEAVLKRTLALPTRADEQHLMKFGNSILNIANQTLNTEGVETPLTFREAKMLQLFLQHKNKLLERDFILKLVWGDDVIIVGRSIDVFVSRLRKLLKDNPSVKISNVHSVGYRFDLAT
jgi:two-component system, OmpR family, response regulator